MQVLNKRVSEDGVYIGRPSKFGNPFVIGRDGARDDVVRKYEEFVRSRPELMEAAKRELRGKNLVCWCAPYACHGDVLLRIANEETEMNFAYEEYETSSELGMRWYHTPHGAFPSITTVLGLSEPPEKQAALKKWQDALGPVEAAKKSKAATDHGTMVHLLAERFLKGEDPYAPANGQAIPPADVAAFNSLKLKLKQIVPWGQEKSVYSPTLEVAGRFDCAGTYKGKPSIIDFKTSNKIKQHADIESYKLQLCFYACAHNELFGTDIEQGVILMASAGGMPQEFVVDVSEHIDALVDRIQIFWSKVLPKV